MSKKFKVLIVLLILMIVFPSNLISAQNLYTETSDSNVKNEATIDSSVEKNKELENTTEFTDNMQEKNLVNLETADEKINEGVTIYQGTVSYPNGADSIVATVDWISYGLTIDLPHMESGETMTLSLGEQWAVSENIFDVNGYRFTPSGDGKFTITALTDKPSGNLSLDLPLRYRENIQNDEETIPITPNIDYKGVIYSGEPTLVEVKKYKDNIPPGELIKKDALGKDEDGNAVWRMFVNYNRVSLQGKEFTFKDTPSSGQKIIKESILVYEVQNTTNSDGSRNLESGDVYSYWVSHLLQNSVTSNGDLVFHSTGNDNNATLYSGQPYYVYYKTEIPKGVPDEDVKNTVSIEIQDGSGRTESSTSGLSSTPSSGGSGSNVDSKINVDVTKQWNDNSNQDGKRPDSIKVQLYADGVALGTPVTLSKTTNWTYQWKDLDEYSTGKKITYSVQEVDVPLGYTVTATETTPNNWLITNFHEPEKIDISGTKTWKDDNNKYGQRPSDIEINLLVDGQVIATTNTNELLNWQYQFTNLPKYKDGKEIHYEVSETAVPGYKQTVTGYDIENKYILGKTDFTVTKEWDDKNNQDGKRPDSIKVQLYADGVALGTPVTLSKTTNWTYQWTNLDEYNSTGKKITYSVQEVDVPLGYTVRMTVVKQNVVVITNVYKPIITIPGLDDSGLGNRPELPKTGLNDKGNPTVVNNSNNTNSTKRTLPKTGENFELYLVNIGMVIVLVIFLRYLFKYNEQQNIDKL